MNELIGVMVVAAVVGGKLEALYGQRGPATLTGMRWEDGVPMAVFTYEFDGLEGVLPLYELEPNGLPVHYPNPGRDGEAIEIPEDGWDFFDSSRN